MFVEKKAAREGGSSHNTHSHSSKLRGSAKAPFKAIGDTIAGQQEGSRFVRDLVDGTAAPDALHQRLREIGNDALRLRGFCRAIQKIIERAAL